MSAEVMARLGQDYIEFRCPGCKEVHVINVGQADGPRWSWNGDLVRPTLTPSVSVRSGHFNQHKPEGHECWCTYDWPEGAEPKFSCYVCHSFVRDGQIQFLSDCTHELVGETVALQPWDPVDG